MISLHPWMFVLLLFGSFVLGMATYMQLDLIIKSRRKHIKQQDDLTRV